MEETDDRTCPRCHKDLEGDAIESLSDLHYNSQGVAYTACPHCGVSLRVEEEERWRLGVSDWYYYIRIEEPPNA